MRLIKLQPEFVQTMPETLQEGILYISYEYNTSIHLCACGCGEKTVTSFGRKEDWDLKNNPVWIDGQDVNRITIRPSIGNQKFLCKSHYLITNNLIDWQ